MNYKALLVFVLSLFFLFSGAQNSDASPLQSEVELGWPKGEYHVHFGSDPVNLKNGNLYFPTTDLSIPCVGFPLSVTRSYNSRSLYTGIFGFGWSSNLDIRAEVQKYKVVMMEADGFRETFTFVQQKGGVRRFRSPGGNKSIEIQKDRITMVNRQTGRKRIFDAKGKILERVDRYGNSQKFVYNAKGHLSQVKDAAGRLLKIKTDASGKVVQITDPIGRTIRYGYDARSNLTSVIDRAGHKTGFSYDDLHNLVRIDYLNGGSTKLAYDTQRDLIVKEEGPEKRSTSYRYKIDPKNPERWTVEVIDALGNTTRYDYSKNGSYLIITDALGGQIISDARPRPERSHRPRPTPTPSRQQVTHRPPQTPDPSSEAARMEQCAKRLATANSLPGRFKLSKLEMKILMLLDRFDSQHAKWRESKSNMGKDWTNLGDEFVNVCWEKPLSVVKKNDAPFVLRGRLIAGECYLFAAVDFMRFGKRDTAIQMYHKGLRLVETALRGVRDNKAFDRLPDFAEQPYTQTGGKKKVHPLAGYEFVGTSQTTATVAVMKKTLLWADALTANGLVKKELYTLLKSETATVRYPKNLLAGIGYKHRTISQYQPFVQKLLDNGFTTERGLEAYINDFLARDEDSSRRLVKLYRTYQAGTQETARRFLSEYCPWGVEMYFMLEQAGLTRDIKKGAGLDYRILLPFQTERPDGKPLVSDVVVTFPRIPMHVSDEMRLIVGDGKVGYLSPLKKKEHKIEWDWVGEPTYLVRYLSPWVYEPTVSELCGDAMEATKLVFGGPVEVLQDRLLNKLVNVIGNYYGKDSDIYYMSWLFVEGNDKDLVTSDYLLESKYPNPTLYLKKFGVYFFGRVDEYIREGLYEGLDPRKYTMGKTYNGQPIPPVFLRGDVLGLQKVGKNEYMRSIQAVRLYVLVPGSIVSKPLRKTYDLNKNPECWDVPRRKAYVTEQELFRSAPLKPVFETRRREETEDARLWAWRELNAPYFGFRNYVRDFSPWCQILKINLPKKDFEKWKKDAPPPTHPYVQLWLENPKRKKRMRINERIEKPDLRLVVYNTHNERGKEEYISKNSSYRAFAPRPGQAMPTRPASYCFFDASDRRMKEVKKLAFELENRLCTRYIVKITQGKNGKVLAEYPIVFMAGRGTDRRKVTGKLKSPESGAVVLTFEPGTRTKPVELREIKIEPEKTEVTVGQSVSFKAIFVDTNGNKIKGDALNKLKPSFQWSVNNPSVASISGKGNEGTLEPIKAGQKVTVICSTAKVRGTAEVTIVASEQPIDVSGKLKKCNKVCKEILNDCKRDNCKPIYSGCAVDCKACGSRVCVYTYDNYWCNLHPAYLTCAEPYISSYISTVRGCNQKYTTGNRQDRNRGKKYGSCLGDAYDKLGNGWKDCWEKTCEAKCAESGKHGKVTLGPARCNCE